MAILVISFILGLVVVLKENIALPAWAYVVSLLLGIFIAPLVSIPTYNDCQTREVTNITIEHYTVCSIWQRHCYEQPVKDVGRFAHPRTPCW